MNAWPSRAESTQDVSTPLVATNASVSKAGLEIHTPVVKVSNTRLAYRGGFYELVKILILPSAPCDDVNCGPHAQCKVMNLEAQCHCDRGYMYKPTDIALGCLGKLSYRIIIIKQHLSPASCPLRQQQTIRNSTFHC